MEPETRGSGMGRYAQEEVILELCFEETVGAGQPTWKKWEESKRTA